MFLGPGFPRSLVAIFGRISFFKSFWGRPEFPEHFCRISLGAVINSAARLYLNPYGHNVARAVEFPPHPRFPSILGKNNETSVFLGPGIPRSLVAFVVESHF